MDRAVFLKLQLKLNKNKNRKRNFLPKKMEKSPDEMHK